MSESQPPPTEITAKLFKKWRSPRTGNTNPERMNNPVWEWLVRSQLTAYAANQEFRGPSPFKAGPGWCFSRFGQSKTELTDGRVIYIGGEHEDHYDPDFFIYNDVVVQHPDGRLEIYGYPPEVFPPTDFHSATLAGDQIFLIGSLGYFDKRHYGKTPVMVLDLSTFAISQLATTGPAPGWIHDHQAMLENGGESILLTGGKLDREDQRMVDNIDDWRLHLKELRWERLTKRNWQRWEMRRKDGDPSLLFDIQMEMWNERLGLLGMASSIIGKVGAMFDVPSLEEKLGRKPDFELFERRYRPTMKHEPLPQNENEFQVHRVLIDGVIVRYAESMGSVQLTIEGELPAEIGEQLANELCEKLATLENTPYERIQL